MLKMVEILFCLEMGKKGFFTVEKLCEKKTCFELKKPLSLFFHYVYIIPGIRSWYRVVAKKNPSTNESLLFLSGKTMI